MNNARRAEIARIVEQIESNVEDLRAVYDEDMEAFDNMPEGLQNSEKGQEMEQISADLCEAIDAIDGALGTLNDIAG